MIYDWGPTRLTTTISTRISCEEREAVDKFAIIFWRATRWIIRNAFELTGNQVRSCGPYRAYRGGRYTLIGEAEVQAYSFHY